MCTYTSHGHCGVLDTSGNIKNTESIAELGKQAVAFAKAGWALVILLFYLIC